MEAWFLREWQQGSAWQIVLRPLSWLYALLTALRRLLYRIGLFNVERVDVPVIVVGNITVGGTGKTPLVLAIVQHLQKSGRRCGIISRGYTRESASAQGTVIHVAPDAGDSPRRPAFSDEATLLATRSGVPVYVAADRPAAARALLAAHPDVDVIISDDGLQHYALHRDIEICVIDGARGFGNAALLPAGPLREPQSRLARIDAILVNGISANPQWSVSAIAPHIPSFSMALGNELLVRVRDKAKLSMEEGVAAFSGRKIVAIAGTGNPSRFFAHLSTLGLAPGATHAFPDHHPYTAADFEPLNADIIVMTEKDAVKCKRFADDRMWFMRVDAILPDTFGDFIVKRLAELEK
ncbi:MAG: tetraacyldisaccharide 4'-kinase [Betaproteobacteria bacterium]